MLTPPTREEVYETILKRSSRLELGLDDMRGKLIVENLSAGFGPKKVLEDISIPFKDNTVTAIIGPSGCGKSTFIRCLNRMHEVSHGAWTKGHVSLDGEDMYAPDKDPVKVRRKIGLVDRQAEILIAYLVAPLQAMTPSAPPGATFFAAR